LDEPATYSWNIVKMLFGPWRSRQQTFPKRFQSTRRNVRVDLNNLPHFKFEKVFFVSPPPQYFVGNIGCGDLKIESDKEPPAIKLYSQIRSGIRKLSVSHDTSRFQQTCLFCLTDYVVPTTCELSACCPVGFTTKLNTRTWNGVGLLLQAVYAVCSSWTRCCCVYVRVGRSDVPLFVGVNVSFSYSPRL